MTPGTRKSRESRSSLQEKRSTSRSQLRLLLLLAKLERSRAAKDAAIERAMRALGMDVKKLGDQLWND